MADFAYVGLAFLVTPPPGAFVAASSTDVATQTESAAVVVLPATAKTGSDTATQTESGPAVRPALAPSPRLAPSATLAPSAGVRGGSVTVIIGPAARSGSDTAALRESATVQAAGPMGDAVVKAQPVEVLHVVDLRPADVVLDGPAASSAARVQDVADLVVDGPDLTVGKAGVPTGARGIPPVYTPRPWRLIAQRILTGEFVSWELPVTDPEIEWQLSGTTQISGSFKPQIRDVADLGLEPWGTWIHLEEDGEIRASAIMQPTSVEADGTFAFTAVGPHGYASRLPYRDRLELIQADPAQVVRLLWAHIQSFDRGNLGVDVIGSTPVRHRIVIDYPQAGERRFDLRFSEDENITEKAPIEEPGDAYADTVFVGGKGEGYDRIFGSAAGILGGRLRLPVLVDDKTIASQSRATAIAAEELAARLAALVEVPEIVVAARHRNAPLGSFGPGDEIRPLLTYPYVGRVEAWHRVTSLRYLPLTSRMVVGLTRRGEFRG
jgi:RecA/RadA recombinase